MNLMNLGSDGDITQAVDGKLISPDISTRRHESIEGFTPGKSEIEWAKIEGAKERTKVAKTELAFQAPRAVRGWMDIIKTIAIVFVGLFFLVGGFASLGAIIDFMKENIWFDVIALLFLLIWIRRR